MTPSAPARVRRRTWAGRETPKPTATGIGLAARTSPMKRATPAGSDRRVPVTPTSETA